MLKDDLNFDYGTVFNIIYFIAIDAILYSLSGKRIPL